MLVLKGALSLLAAGAAMAWRPEEYPVYCSKDMNQHAIPELDAQIVTDHNPKLKQVQVMIRHGARTPYAKMFCWENYDVAWNCNVTELMVPSLKPQADETPIWLFRKVYDGSPNYLGGDCFTGQLIEEGYEQEEANGEHLRNAYIGAGPQKLYSTATLEDLDQNTMYFRSDDSQRVLMSAQILLHKLFNVSDQTIVPFHTGDYNLDSMYPNSRVCPRLDDFEDEAYDSKGWQDGNNSASANEMAKELSTILGQGWSWYNLLDCFMTAVCTDRDIPEGMTQELFDNSIDHVVWQYGYPVLFNDQEWAKHALGPITRDIRTRMQAKIDDEDDAYNFVIYSGHDTTIMPFLAALGVWDLEWASYASMVTMELWETSTGDDYVRMVYNGKELILPGCSDAFCPTASFMDATAFAAEDMDCSVEDKKTKKEKDDDNDGLSDGTWTLIVVFSTIGGVILGSIAMYVAMKKLANAPDKGEEYGHLNP